ncbi:hypothetical protein GE21DRAFT_1063384 [Neurospora crassa]|nr:hypothetical protein GE21DRAFT_1063384 [Neurospora crassa]
MLLHDSYRTKGGLSIVTFDGVLATVCFDILLSAMTLSLSRCKVVGWRGSRRPASTQLQITTKARY